MCLLIKNMMTPLLALATICIVAVTASRDYVIGPAGTFTTHSPVPGFILATLEDVQGSGFLSVYNALGVNLTSTTPPSFPGNYCPFIAIQGGFLATGSPLSVSPTLIGPFTSGGALQDGGSLTAPVWMGTVSATDFQQNEFVGAFNQTFISGLFVMSEATLAQSSLSCTPSVASIGLYRRAQFMVAPYGSSFPTPPVVGAMLVTLADLASDTFLETFNINGLVASGVDVSNVCCAMRVFGGFLTLSTSVIAPYTAQGNIQCPQSALTGPVWLGTTDSGAYPDAFIGSLNASVLAELTVDSDATAVCGSSSNVWALYKVHTLPTPPTPAPAHGDCYNMDIRVTYYLPNMVICLAERYTYYMRMNQTYSAIGMTSLNECGGTIGSVSAQNMELQPYNDSYMVGRTSGATSCDCSAVTNWGFVPFNQSGHNEMSTICYKSIDEFYFCEVLMQLNNGPVQCPPGP